MSESNNESVKITTTGKKYLKKTILEFDETPEGLAELRKYIEAGGFGFHDFSIKFIDWLKDKLQSQGFDTNLPMAAFRGQYLEGSNSIYFNDDLVIKPDTINEFYIDFIMYSERANCEELSVERRIEEAFNAGDTFRKIKVYSEYGKDQSNNAKSERKPKINKIIKKLAKKEDHTAADLWEDFLSELDATEITDNEPHRCTFISPDTDKQDKMTFSRFSTSLGEFKKVPPRPKG